MTTTLTFPRNVPPILVLVGGANAGKGAIGAYLKQHHGFARMAFAEPLYDGVRALYGVTPGEILAGDKDNILPRIGKSVRALAQDLGAHLRDTGGIDILIRRLVDRSIERGTWKNSPLVVTDARLPLELQWAREAGAHLAWVSRPRPAPVRFDVTEHVAQLRRDHFRAGDVELENDGTPEQLYERVDAWLEAVGHLDKANAS